MDELHSAEHSIALVAYCSFDDEKTHSAYNILSSFLRQILDRKGHVSKAVDKYYKTSSQNRQTRPDMSVIKQLLSEELKEFGKAFVLLDGLDEVLSTKDKEEILEAIQSLQPLPSLLVTSRPAEAISSWFYDTAHENKYRISPKQNKVHQHSRCGIEAVHGPVSQISDFSEVENKRQDVDIRRNTTACYHCNQCNLDCCIDCYDKYDVCLNCEGDKSNSQWLWPGSILIEAAASDLDVYIDWRIRTSERLRRLVFNKRSPSTGSLITEISEKVRKECQGM